tara:strand:- start:169 stop:1449 length:1281 start_codon:yes stop_codon:yes gene_type:complete
MISLEDNFNQVSLHNPSKEILSIYQGIEEIQEYDPRGYKMVRPLFSHSDFPRFLGVDKVKYNEFNWDKKFIYPVVLHHNNELAAKYISLLPVKIIEKIRSKQCKLILDNTMEGDRVSSFYTELYSSIDRLKLPASQIYYVTNSLVAELEHEKWKTANKRASNNINVISFMYNVMDVQRLKKLGHLPDKVNIEEEIQYKRDNFINIKEFLKVNRTGRPERNLLMFYINKNKLYDKFNLSFPDLPDYNYPNIDFGDLLSAENIKQVKDKCPFDIDSTDSTNHGEPGFGEGKFNADLPFQPLHYRNSLISVVMCAFPFVENACHLHSSTFNPIYCGHPVIQFGPYKHLEILKSNGFKTFDKWWDEDYDNLTEGWDRFKGVLRNIDELNKKSKKELFDMYVDMKDVLQHNSDLIQNYNGKNLLRKRILDE